MLPLFGQNLFRDGPAAFAPVENIPATADYVIGPGDELVMRAWGQVDIDYRTAVDRNGLISIWGQSNFSHDKANCCRR